MASGSMVQSDVPKRSDPGVVIKDMILKLVDFSIFSNVLSSIISFTGSFFFNTFSILFLSFFFLYDNTMMPKLLLLNPGKV